MRAKISMSLVTAGPVKDCLAMDMDILSRLMVENGIKLQGTRIQMPRLHLIRDLFLCPPTLHGRPPEGACKKLLLLTFFAMKFVQLPRKKKKKKEEEEEEEEENKENQNQKKKKKKKKLTLLQLS